MNKQERKVLIISPEKGLDRFGKMYLEYMKENYQFQVWEMEFDADFSPIHQTQEKMWDRVFDLEEKLKQESIDSGEWEKLDFLTQVNKANGWRIMAEQMMIEELMPYIPEEERESLKNFKL